LIEEYVDSRKRGDLGGGRAIGGEVVTAGSVAHTVVNTCRVAAGDL
jgi:hypothetical protein